MIQRISQEEADNFIPLKEDFTGTSVNECPYFTMIPIEEEILIVREVKESITFIYFQILLCLDYLK